MEHQRENPKQLFKLATGVDLACAIDDYTDGWAKPDAVILLHGIAEKGDVWRPWVPHLGRRFIVLRPDLRGYGESSRLTTDVIEDARKLVTIEYLADDIEALVASLDCRRVHLVGAKLGALIAIELGQRQLSWVATMTLAGMLVSPKAAVTGWHDEWIDHIDRFGVESWARMTMPGRMGSDLPPVAMEWWAKIMGTAPTTTVKACMRMVELRAEPVGLERIQCPTLVITSAGSAPSDKFNQQQSIEDMTRLQARIRNSEFYPVTGADSYYIAGTHPDLCAQKAAEFMGRHAH
jgi:3-oxoadipate enol-lactonase